MNMEQNKIDKDYTEILKEAENYPQLQNACETLLKEALAKNDGAAVGELHNAARHRENVIRVKRIFSGNQHYKDYKTIYSEFITTINRKANEQLSRAEHHIFCMICKTYCSSGGMDAWQGIEELNENR